MLINQSNIIVFSGGAKGADNLGELYAINNFIEVRTFIPDWNNKGKKAGILRNQEMADNADALIAFWDGKSKGTKNMIEEAKKRNLKVRVIKY